MGFITIMQMVIIKTNTFGKYIKQLRGDKSIRCAAKDIGISHTYLDTLEKGIDKRTNSVISPSVVTVNKVANYYNVSFNDLCDMILNDVHNYNAGGII